MLLHNFCLLIFYRNVIVFFWFSISLSVFFFGYDVFMCVCVCSLKFFCLCVNNVWWVVVLVGCARVLKCGRVNGLLIAFNEKW